MQWKVTIWRERRGFLLLRRGTEAFQLEKTAWMKIKREKANDKHSEWQVVQFEMKHEVHITFMLEFRVWGGFDLYPDGGILEKA